MSNPIQGIHHVTAIAGGAKRNLDFYTRVLGLRLVKKTVNFNDPGTYHFYFGNETGDPGTILTFFPWEGITAGRRGSGQVTETAFSVPSDSLGFWQERLEQENIIYNKPARRFDEEYLTLIDPDGLKLELVARTDSRKPFTRGGVGEEHAIRGFQGVTLSLEGYQRTADILTEVFGYVRTEEAANRHRYVSEDGQQAAVVDLVDLPAGQRGHVAGGSVHHVAFRVPSNEAQLEYREKLLARGLNVTPPIDRDYFKAIYFREPGGVLFEVATDPPGFTRDEPLETLGQSLKLPAQYETQRAAIEQQLPPLD